MKPTEEQIKKFWEWCGFDFSGDNRFVGFPDKSLHPISELPSLEGIEALGNLFKWAVPKLREKGCRAMLSDKTDGKYVLYMGRVYGKQTRGFLDALNEDPALALFWAIWNVFNKEEK